MYVYVYKKKVTIKSSPFKLMVLKLGTQMILDVNAKNTDVTLSKMTGKLFWDIF